jgi:hypothetical protein
MPDNQHSAASARKPRAKTPSPNATSGGDVMLRARAKVEHLADVDELIDRWSRYLTAAEIAAALGFRPCLNWKTVRRQMMRVRQ